MRTAMLFVAASACQPSSDVTDTHTDGGTWRVDLQSPPDGPGESDLRIDVTPAGGLLQEITLAMPGGSDAAGAPLIEDLGNGAFSVAVELGSGLWVLDGEVADERTTEGFRLKFEVP